MKYMRPIGQRLMKMPILINPLCLWLLRALPLFATLFSLERETGFEPATYTLARYRSTN
ncbi:uncharacterized protein METZ01_LOCUS295097 [marine metagenome]|uniref:Uncharacterized protein n=1 Tax=marine metagenome TaxID=408172 RepID=A0A382M079_9ZZZZ